MMNPVSPRVAAMKENTNTIASPKITLAIDPAELRRKNLWCSEDFPVVSVTGQQLDTFTAMASIVYPHPFDTLVLKAGCYRVDVTISHQGTVLDRRTTTLQVTTAQAVRAPALRAAAIPSPATSGGVVIPSWLVALLGLLAAFNVALLATILQRRHSKKGRKRAPVNG